MLFFINVISSRRARLHEFASLHDPVQLHIYTNTYCTFKDPDFTITQLKHLYAYKPQSVHNQFTVKVGLPSNKRHISRTSSSIRSLKGFPIVNLDVLQLHWIGLDWTALDPHQDNHLKKLTLSACKRSSWSGATKLQNWILSTRRRARVFYIYITYGHSHSHTYTFPSSFKVLVQVLVPLPITRTEIRLVLSST